MAKTSNKNVKVEMETFVFLASVGPALSGHLRNYTIWYFLVGFGSECVEKTLISRKHFLVD